ncbi:MAG: CapA family protein [Bulleidia sp.]
MRKKEKIFRFLALGSLTVIMGINAGCASQASVQSSVTSVVEPEEVVKEPEVMEATLFMMGDALLHQPIENSVVQPDGSYAFTLLDRIGQIASEYDLRYWNQETIIGGDQFGVQGYPRFNGMTAWADYLVNDLHFNMVSLANNHALDMGMEGLEHSVNYWNSHPEVCSTGTYLSQEDYEDMEIRTVNGISYAFLSTTYGMNGLYPPEGMEYAVDCFDGRIQEVLDRVAKAKTMADVVITAVHWGDEYHLYPNEFQTTFAQQLADAGCDIIIGNHPHAIQPVQWLNDHRTICFYALGNCVAAQYDLSRIEMMAGLKIVKTVMPDDTVNVEIQDVHADLMYCYYDDNLVNNFDIVPFSQMSDDTWLYNHAGVYEEYKQVITAMDDSITVGGFE